MKLGFAIGAGLAVSAPIMALPSPAPDGVVERPAALPDRAGDGRAPQSQDGTDERRGSTEKGR